MIHAIQGVTGFICRGGFVTRPAGITTKPTDLSFMVAGGLRNANIKGGRDRDPLKSKAGGSGIAKVKGGRVTDPPLRWIS